MTAEKQTQAPLRSIYEEDGAMPDMTKLDRTPGSRWAKSFGYFVGIVVLGTLIAWLGFRLFIPSNPGDVVAVTIDAPKQVVAGAKMVIAVRYENQDRNPLALAVLKVRYPKEFVPESVTPRSDDDNLTTWTLGTIDRNGSGVIEIQGRALGNIGTTAQIQSTLTYKPASFNAEFTSLANQEFSIDTAPVEITFDGPTDVSAGQSVTVAVRYKNISDDPIANAQLSFVSDDAFSVTKTSKPPLRDTTWALPVLESGAAGELSMTGIITSSAKEQTVLSFKVVTQMKREEIVLASAEYQLAVTQGDLSVAIERDSDAPVRMGDAMSGQIVILNNATVPLGDITVQLTGSNAIDWSRASSSEKITTNKSGITWSGAQIEKLKTIPATGRVVLPFTMYIPAQDVPSLVLSATAKSAKREGKPVTLTAKSADVAVAVGSSVRAEARALYYDGAGIPLGAGPLPPRVGEETKYRIIWKINNGSRDLSAVSLVAALPETVTFGQKQGIGAGSVSFDEATRTVRWTISRLPASVPEVIAQFDILLTPVTNDQGRSVELMGAGTLTAQDPLVADPITTTIPHMTTDLSHDAKAGGRGVVLP